MVKNRGVDLKTGFARAGYPDLYPAFMEQFPTAKIDSVTIAPGDTFEWIVFKKKATGRVAIQKDVTWKGAASFEAYRFNIDKDGKRHEFVVPYACGNVALRNMVPIPPAPVTVPRPAAAPAAPVQVQVPVQAPAQAPAPAPVAPRTPPAPVTAPRAAVASPPPALVAPPAPAPAPVATQPVAAVPPPVPVPVAKSQGGLLFDVGLSRQFDPANYLFARVGYEVPLFERLYLIGLVGGSIRWMGHDGGSAFTADAMLDYHWLGGLSFGLGAGYWSGNDGQVDLLADAGFLVAGDPNDRNSSLFLEARLPFDELDNVNEYGRLGVGLRFRF